MAIELERGKIQGLTPPDKHGAVTCRINGYNVNLPRDLADSVKEGDDVIVAGALRKDVFHAMAVKDFSRDKAIGVDCTNYVLLMSVGFILFTLLGVFGLQRIGTGEVYVETIDYLLSIAALIFAGVFLWHILQVVKATRRVRYSTT